MGPLCYSFWLIKTLYFPLLLPMPQMPSSRQAILSNQLRDWYWNSYCSSHTFSPSCPILTYYYMHLCLLLVLCLGCQVDLADLQYLYCKAIIIIIIITCHTRVMTIPSVATPTLWVNWLVWPIPGRSSSCYKQASQNCKLGTHCLLTLSCLPFPIPKRKCWHMHVTKYDYVITLL